MFPIMGKRKGTRTCMLHVIRNMCSIIVKYHFESSLLKNIFLVVASSSLLGYCERKTIYTRNYSCFHIKLFYFCSFHAMYCKHNLFTKNFIYCFKIFCTNWLGKIQRDCVYIWNIKPNIHEIPLGLISWRENFCKRT